MKFPRAVLFLGLLGFCGCAGLVFKNEAVSFDSPAQVLHIEEVQPDEREQKGIVLRLLPPDTNESKAEESLKIYSQLHDNRGLRFDLHESITHTFKRIEGKDSYILRSVTVFSNEGGQITEEAEVSPRGEILRFIEGRHDSKIGKFNVLNESRTPSLPEGPVKTGDKWTFTEKMDARMESAFVKEKDPTPYVVQSESELAGFAVVNGRRCAVVKTKSAQDKKETMKVLWKTLTAAIHADIEETEYLDYAKGEIVGRVTWTRSHSVFADLKMEDNGISQAIYRLKEN